MTQIKSIKKYLTIIQLILFNVIGQSSIQSAAIIQTEQNGTNLNLELLMAASAGNKHKVVELIGQGANVNFTDNKNGNTSLMWAAMNGHKEIVEVLLKAKANVNAKNLFNETALIKATHHKETVEVLLKADADVTAIDINKWNALLIASRFGYEKIVELLLKAGANIEHKNLKGKKAIDFAKINYWDSELIKKNKPAIVKMLECEQSRRESVVKKWIKEILARKITESTSSKLIPDIANIIAEYSDVEYTDLPLEYRLNS